MSLEKFINDNRGEFDSEDASENIWNKVEAGLGLTPKKKIHLNTRRNWLAAASIILLASAGIFFYTMFKEKPKNIVTTNETNISKEMTDAIDTSYSTQLYQFAKIIEDKQNELKQDQKTEPELYSQFLRDNNQLDSSYSYLKSSLKTNPNKEILLGAMIKNLQLKIDLLNRQLQIIKQSKQNKNYESKTI